MEYAQWQVARARELNAQTGLDVGDHLEAWDRFIGAPPEGYAPPDPTEPVRAMPEPKRAELTEHLPCLMNRPLFRNWGVEPADLRPWLEEWSSLADRYHDDAADESAREEAFQGLQRVLGEAAGQVVTPEMSGLLRERLLDAARKFRWRDQPHEADVAAAIVLEIDAASGPGEVGFFRGLADNGLSMLSQILEDGQDPEALRYDPMSAVAEE
jgi:hypothetical protein